MEHVKKPDMKAKRITNIIMVAWVLFWGGGVAGHRSECRDLHRLSQNATEVLALRHRISFWTLLNNEWKVTKLWVQLSGS